MRYKPLTAALVWAVLACNGMDGPCSFDYRTAALEIESAANARTSANVSVVYLRDFTLSGKTVSDPTHVLSANHTRGIVDEGDRLKCTVPCAFATEPGPYAFTVSAPGYQDRRVAVQAEYVEVKLGCPGWASGPTRLQIPLEPNT